MSLKIISATYGSKNVSEKLNTLINNNKLQVKASNDIFGDPDVGKVKKLSIKYSFNDIEKNVQILENEFIFLPELQNERLGIFYTNNNIDSKILNKSLNLIDVAAKKNNVDILTSSWQSIPNNPFIEIISKITHSTHFNIAYQILTLLLTAEKYNPNYKYVSFLEHDVFYGEDYFLYDDFNDDVICNQNFIGFKDGFQTKIQNDEPLHELTMNFKFALDHFKEVLIGYIIEGTVLEPKVKYGKWVSKQPSLHINHGKNFTSHYDIYSKKRTKNHPYWGDSVSLLE